MHDSVIWKFGSIPPGPMTESPRHKLLRGGVFIALDERSALLALGRSYCNSTRKHLHDGDRRVNNTGRQNLTVHLAIRRHENIFHFYSTLNIIFCQNWVSTFYQNLFPQCFYLLHHHHSNGMEERPRRTIACLPPHRSVGRRRTPPPASAVVASVPARRQSHHRSSSASAAAGAPGVSRQVSSTARWP